MKLHKTEIDPEIYYYFLKSGNKRYQYRHKYYDALGERKEKKKSSFKTEKAALKELLKVKADLLSGQVKKVENNRMTVGQWLDIWYKTYCDDWEITSRKQRKNAINKHMKPRLGKYVLTELDRTTYKRVYINDLLKTYKPSSVQLFHRLFSIAINSAVEDEILTRNRFSKMNIGQCSKLENFLTPEELNIFLHTAKKHSNITNFTLVFLLAYTGLRKGEAFGLKWRNINFKQKTITVDCTRDHYGERSPKTKNSYRTIPIDDVLVDQLIAYQKWCLETKFASGLKLDKENDHVFISKNSGEKSCTNILQFTFKTIYVQLKKEKIRIRKISPHGLRHTHATILISNGVPPVTIADRLGNTPEMINNVYSHSFQELEEKAVTAFSESLAAGAKIGAK